MVLNSAQNLLGPFPDNALSSLAYALLDVHSSRPLAWSQEFQLHRSLATTAGQSLVLGTGGLATFLLAEACPILGKQVVVGPLQQCWQEGYFTNPDAVRQTLALVHRDEDDTVVLHGALHPQMHYWLCGHATLLGKDDQAITADPGCAPERLRVDRTGTGPLFDANTRTHSWAVQGQLLHDDPWGPVDIGSVLEE